jgi:hypothetical protein
MARKTASLDWNIPHIQLDIESNEVFLLKALFRTSAGTAYSELSSSVKMELGKAGPALHCNCNAIASHYVDIQAAMMSPAGEGRSGTLPDCLNIANSTF